jgi:hypothetical protein
MLLKWEIVPFMKDTFSHRDFTFIPHFVILSVGLRSQLSCRDNWWRHRCQRLTEGLVGKLLSKEIDRHDMKKHLLHEKVDSCNPIIVSNPFRSRMLVKLFPHFSCPDDKSQYYGQWDFLYSYLSRSECLTNLEIKSSVRPLLKCVCFFREKQNKISI